jgi:transketolase
MNRQQLSRRQTKYTARVAPKGARLATSAMIASLDSEGRSTVAAPFGHALVDLAKTRDDIVGLTADLSKYTDLHVFAKAYPDRFYQMGMAEAVMMSAAAGLAREGFTPFATTYAVFASRRAYDFIIMAIAEENLPVKIVCALPGLTTGYGPSHQATEDLAIMRGMPNLTIIDPCDAVEIDQATRAIADLPGPVYMRLLRGQVPNVLGEYGYQFRPGKAQMLRDGRDVLFVSSGFMTMRVLDAAKALQKDGVDCGVLHVPTIKPLDVETIVAEAGKSGRLVVTAENHSVTGGLGEAVAATLMRAGAFVPFRQIGLPDAFLDAGALPTLHDQYGISVDAVTASVKGWLA